MTESTSGRRIPAVSLDNSGTWERILPRLRELVLRGGFTLGPEVEEFERRAAETFGCNWAVGTSSGTSALALALRASGLPPASRVALPANTFFATFEAVVQAGHVPVVVDHDENYCIDLDQLETLDVEAVIPVHLYGLPVDMAPLTTAAARRGWWILEDCSQAHGATIDGRPIGSFGDAAAFSAYPTKNLGAWGDAGFVTGSDPAIEERLRRLRHHGQGQSNVHEDIGGTERLDNLQALVLSDKLETLHDEVEGRRRVAATYTAALEHVQPDLPRDIGGRTHAYHQYVIRVPRRDAVRAHMEAAGIATSVHYPTPVHLQVAAKGRCKIPHPPERAERWAGEILSLPIYPGLEEPAAARVAAALEKALGTTD
jgi:dTDP-4-amino-4,6-dideoxygalactose transaminase